MVNRTLTRSELLVANALLSELRARLEVISAGDRDLLFAYRRKVFKELTYDERGKPMDRRKLKIQKREAQNGLCAICRRSLPDRYAVLDRTVAVEGYTAENTRLICQECDTATQASRGYA